VKVLTRIILATLERLAFAKKPSIESTNSLPTAVANVRSARMRASASSREVTVACCIRPNAWCDESFPVWRRLKFA